MRRYKTAFPSVLIAAAACIFFSASCSRQTDGEDSASARGRAVSQQAKDVKKSPGEQLADLCGKGDFRGAAGLAGLVADPGARKKLLDKIRPSVSKSLDAALDSCDFKTAVDAANLLSLFIPDSERKALEGEISKRYRALYNDGRFGKVVEFYNLASPKFLSGAEAEKLLQSAYANLGEAEKSFEVAGKLYKSNPDSIEIQEIYINAKIDSGRAGEALSEVRGALLAKDKYNADYHRLAARAAEAAGDIDLASEEYLQAAYYSKGKISILVECGNFFVKHSKNKEYKKILAPAARINQDSPIETVVAYGYLQALGYSKSKMRDLNLLGNVIDYAPLFIDAHFLLADWLMESGVKEDVVHAVGLLQALSLRFKEKNDAVMIKILEISSSDAEFDKIAKEILRKLADRFSEPGYGNLSDRKKFLEVLESLSKKNWELAGECKAALLKIPGAKMR